MQCDVFPAGLREVLPRVRSEVETADDNYTSGIPSSFLATHMSTKSSIIG